MLNFIKRKVHNLFHPIIGEIWMLHRVVEERSVDKKQRDLEITPQYLKLLIEEYLEKGYRFVSIDKMYDEVVCRKIYRHKPLYISITFDDGYADNYENAYPILKQYNIPFTIYVTAGFIDNQLEMWWYPKRKLALSVEQIKELDRDPLCTIGAHTMTHPMLDKLSYKEQKKEVIESKKKLEELLGHNIDHFSYPHGAHDEETIQIVEELGFKTSTIAWGGGLRVGDNIRILNRILIKHNLNK